MPSFGSFLQPVGAHRNRTQCGVDRGGVEAERPHRTIGRTVRPEPEFCEDKIVDVGRPPQRGSRRFGLGPSRPIHRRLNLHACETAAKRSPLGWILGEGYYLKKSGYLGQLEPGFSLPEHCRFTDGAKRSCGRGHLPVFLEYLPVTEFFPSHRSPRHIPTQAQADALFLGDQLKPVLQCCFLISRRARALMKENLALAAIHNAFAVPLAIAGLVTPLIAAVAMSGSSLIVTLNALRARRGYGR